MEPAPGERLAGTIVAGKYRIRRVVGSGSMGVVCEAEHLEIGKRLAIKLIDASLAGMKDIAMRFRQEARAASLVESQHIVQVFDVGADDDLGLYLVMEYLTGEDLAQMLHREGRLSPDATLRIALQVARGLAKAHEAGVVHRDLKPANIFLTEREDDQPLVKILDFGISKVIDASRADSRLKLTRAGTVVGTPQYMSPEQAQGFSVDARTDVWALGLVLYEMLAGRAAYPELGTYEQFIIHLVQNPPDPLSEVAPWVPAPLAEVVHAAIEHDIPSRIQSCGELARRLIEAHPMPGMRGVSLSMAESADTWADAGVLSPFQQGGAVSPSGDREAHHDTPEDRPRKPLVAAATQTLDESIEVEVDLMETPVPPSAARPSSKIASSGVRAPNEPGEDGETDDAPQFFDREALKRVATQPPPPPTSGEVAVARQPSAPALQGTMPSAGAPVPPARFPIALAAIVFIAVGLVVAVALAFR